MDNNETTPQDKPKMIYCYPQIPTRKYRLNIIRVNSTNGHKRGVNPTDSIDKLTLSMSYIRMIHSKANAKMLRSYFGGHNNCSFLYRLLQSLHVSGNKTASFHNHSLNTQYYYVVAGLSRLLELGYITSIRQSRKMMMLNKYTYDTVYKITRSGKDCLRSIYECIGLM